eukprot:204260-Pelagomonas_calceolata.AAC.3
MARTQKNKATNAHLGMLKERGKPSQAWLDLGSRWEEPSCVCTAVVAHELHESCVDGDVHDGKRLLPMACQ